jgi:peptidoglycan/LPS O-acetylase OafA/YrhL
MTDVLDHQTGRVDELDGLRGILALWVALAHIFCWTGFWEFSLPGPMERIWREFVGAGSAVDTFIILSGFAISFLIHRRPSTYGKFMTGRFFRIYPVYIICLLFGWATTHLAPYVLHSAQWNRTEYFTWMIPVAASESAATGAHFFWHLTLLHGLVPKWLLADSTAAFLPPAWSISLEWQYYLVAPLLAKLVRSGGCLLLLTILSSLALRYGQAWENGHPAFLLLRLPLFLIGIGSYHMYAGFCSSKRGRSNIFAVCVAALICVAVVVSWHRVALVAWALGFGCIFVRGNDPFSWTLLAVRRMLLHPWLQVLGRMSFPLYLVHYPLIIVLISALLYLRPTLTSQHAALCMLCLGLPLILMTAGILHRYIELPFMSVGKRLNERNERSKVANHSPEPKPQNSP